MHIGRRDNELILENEKIINDTIETMQDKGFDDLLRREIKRYSHISAAFRNILKQLNLEDERIQEIFNQL